MCPPRNSHNYLYIPRFDTELSFAEDLKITDKGIVTKVENAKINYCRYVEDTYSAPEMFMNIHSIYKIFFKFFRKNRFKVFREKMMLQDDTTLLDVGGYAGTWMEYNFNFPITIINLDPAILNSKCPSNFEFKVMDATNLHEFSDNAFDVGYSNSVIEHVYSWENQKKFAAEIRRVSKSYWVQTPARSFFIEPHYLTPFVHWLSKAMQKKLLRFTLWGFLTKPDKKKINDIVEEIRLLSYREVKELFPEATIIRERFFFLTKSFIAVLKR